jgi:hypothetical protein
MEGHPTATADGPRLRQFSQERLAASVSEKAAVKDRPL